LIYRKLGLPQGYINSIPEVKAAKDVLNSIKHARFLEDKSADEMEAALKEAMDHQNSRAITLAISQIENAGLIQLYPLVEKGKE